MAEIQAEREEQDREATERATAALGLSKEWVLDKLRENVERAMQAVPVKDAKGIPTGEYKYEGAVAKWALELIGKELRMFSDKVAVTTEGSLAELVLASMRHRETSAEEPVRH